MLNPPPTTLEFPETELLFSPEKIPEYAPEETKQTNYESSNKREKVVKEKMVLVREPSKIKKTSNFPSISETEVGKQKIVYEENEIAANFDARQAVIYSEILKRPQY